jgi:hypothetical protein
MRVSLSTMLLVAVDDIDVSAYTVEQLSLILRIPSSRDRYLTVVSADVSTLEKK